MLTPRQLMILIPLLPLFAAIITAILGALGINRKGAHLPVILCCIGSCLCSIMLAGHVRSQIAQMSDPESQVAVAGDSVGYEHIETLWTWAHIQDAHDADTKIHASGTEGNLDRDLKIDVSLRADPLTCIMLVMVTFIGSLVAIYAAGYMHGDRGYWRFFAYVAIFVFSMTMLVSVSNFLLLFVFWEAVGACSYLLIGFWYEKNSAAAAGKKAFLVNRIGDFGFALALFLIWTTYGTWNYHDTPLMDGVLGQARLASGAYVGGGLGLAICLLLLLGACGKSAQFPLHVWLPDAMEGPTPVSALIHAATMVTAGVYMVTRCTPMFLAAPAAQMTVACVGGGTALLAGLIALTQYDLKRVLAYSTISQLGYMFLGLGTGTLAGITAGMFHLFTHAFFKALLFLGSGSVMHSMGNVIDMRRFGGLRRIMPITHWTFAFGCLALAGLFPFAGFWSKDAIVGAVHDQASAMSVMLDGEADMPPTEGQHGAGGATGDATEHGDSGGHAADAGHAGHHHQAGHVAVTTHLTNHSSEQLAAGARIYSALYYVALFTAFLTAFYTFRAFFMTFYGEEKVPHEAGGHAHESPPSMWIPLAILSVFAVGIGCILEMTHAFASFLSHTPSLATREALATIPPGPPHLNIAIVSTVIAAVGISIAAYLYLGKHTEAAAIARFMDSSTIGRPYQWSYGKFFFDEIYDWLIVRPLKVVAEFSYVLDRWLVDGIVNLVGWIPKAAGGVTRGLQRGLMPFYGLAMVIGVMTLLAVRVWWGGQ